MLYMENIKIRTAKSEIYLGKAGFNVVLEILDVPGTNLARWLHAWFNGELKVLEFPDETKQVVFVIFGIGADCKTMNHEHVSRCLNR